MLLNKDRFGKLTSKSLDSIAATGLREADAELPCLYRNNSIEITDKTPSKPLSPAAFELSTNLKKSASALAWNVQHFVDTYGLSNVGFLTLTFRDHVTDPKEAQRRFNSLKSNVLASRYRAYIRVMEPMKSGRIHYHLLVALDSDIRTGFDFVAVKNQDYSTANKAIRAEWSFWRKTAPKYRFGRTELMPVRSNSEGIGRYVGKYISKGIESRTEQFKGVRLVEYSRKAKIASTRFQFVSDGSYEWRRKLSIFVHYIADNMGCEPSFDGLRRVLGSRWSYHWRDFIMNIE
ncbi:replication endonuclease [Klebsiella pneumoniae]|uniref:rolling circle replication-associated protein n=1 Tax=Klebsiella pneumoniae TaxID=573 RepID=UPI0011431C87|nr:replication endonuclease [Klebsiella pneumoniae]TYW59106.1 replication endonuclease [Klebsiella pneumoniae]TYW59107.1 replication endonuclease [Klebsiella pneumoniae]